MLKVSVIGLIRLITILIFVPYSVWLVNHRPDDVFIYYRYAQNLAAGLGIVFNPNQYVEGVTSLLWTGLLAGISLIRFPLETWAPLLSLICSCFLLWRLPALAVKIQGRKEITLVDVLATMWVASMPSFAYWSYSGMETSLFALLLVLSVELFLAETNRQLLLSGVLVAMAVLVRPEMLAVIPAFPIYAQCFKGNSFSRIFSWGLMVTTLISLTFVFRYLYFGELLPNTFYAKRGFPLEQTLSNGILYLVNFTGSVLPLPFTGNTALILGATLVLPTIYWGSKRKNIALLSFVSFLMMAAVIYDGGDWMILNRLLVPIAPLLALLILSILDSKAIKGSITIVSLSLMILLNLLSAHRERFGKSGQLNPDNFTTPPYAPFIDYLKDNSGTDDSIALMDIGEIGFRTGLHVIDISGLIDPKIARAPGGFLSKQYPVDWIFEQRPRWIALRNNWCLIDTTLYQSPQLARDYEEVLRLEQPTPMTLFERKK